MTITIADGRGALWQWDTGRRLRVGSGVEQIHYQNKCFGRSVDVDVGDDGTAIIPDELLQDWHPLTAYAYVTDDAGGYTKVQVDFAVHKRARPSDYVYTPTDQMTLQTIQRQIGDLADLTTTAKDTLVAAINEAARTGGGAGSMELRVADGYVQYSRDGGMTWTNLIAMAELKGADGITPTIGDNGNWYLGTTDTGKPSRGEKGEKGDPGKDGANGETGPAGPRGEKGADGSNGKDGKPGEKGADGAPGIYYGTTQPTGDTHPVWIDPDGDHDDGGLLPAVTAADNGKVLRVVSGAWGTVDMPSGGGSTVTWHDDLLAEGTIVKNTAIYYDLGVMLAELREYRTFLYLLKGASNINLNNLYLNVGDSAGKGTIDRGNDGGRICAFEWVDTSKTILRQMHGYSGNPSMVALGKFATDNSNQVGYGIGQFNSMRYVDLSAHAETEHLFLRCSSTPTIEYAYQIRGLTK